MHWALAAIILTVVILMASNNARKLPWINKMRRLRTGSACADWMAPEHVVQKVQADYLGAVDWLQNSQALPFAHHWRQATDWLAGPFLRRYQQLLLRQRSDRSAPFYGVLRADHQLEVRGFSQDGRRCWLIDRQRDRRMATYDMRTHERLVTQDMGSGAMVIVLVFTPEDSRWKFEAQVQQLPQGWERGQHLALVSEHEALPRRIGRDL